MGKNASLGGLATLATDATPSAWERWTRGEGVRPGEVAPHILASWERCREYGLDPLGWPRVKILSADELNRRRRECRAVLSLAHRFSSRLCAALSGCRFVISIADADGYKLESVTAGDLEAPPLPGFDCCGVGEDWSEETHGTNCIGTALKLAAPVYIRSDEHYLAALRGWNCSGVPIRDAAGNLTAVFSLAGPAEEVSLTAHGLAIAAAQEIERELELDAATRRLEAQNRRLVLLNDLERLLGDDIEGKISGAVVECLHKLNSEVTVAFLSLDPLRQQCLTEASCPPDPLLVPPRWRLDEDSPVTKSVTTKASVFLRGGEVPDGFTFGPPRPQTLLVQPFSLNGTVVGALVVGSRNPGALTEDDLELYEAVGRRLSAHAERCALHRELRAESRMRQVILDQMDCGLLVFDLYRARVTWNQVMAPFFTSRGDSASLSGLSQADRDLKYPVRFGERDLKDVLNDVLATGRVSTDEAVILCDPPRTFRVTTSPVTGPDGRVECVLQTYLDITSFRKLEQQKAEFVAMISHELRTPLTGIKGYAQLLAQRFSDDQPYQRLVGGLLRETGELAELVERVVAVNRVELDQKLSLEPLSLRSVLERACAKLRAEASLRGVKLSLKGSDAEVRGDAEALELVFSNLLDNAIKYSPPNSEVTLRQGEEPGGVWVDVTDQGPGIPPEHHEAIFQRFYRVQSPDTVSVPGSGLGLYIVRRLVERLGGRVTVSSRVGEGTTFTVSLPMEVEERGTKADHSHCG